MSEQLDKLKSANAKIKENKVLKEFKEFINRGSVVELAVGVVIGSAFTAIVNSAVNDIIMPIVGLLVGGVNFTTLSIDIPNFFGLDTVAHISYGNFLQAIVNFLIVALCLFLIVRLFNRFSAEKVAADDKKEKEAEANETEEVKLLREIRDSLAKPKKK